MGGVESLWVVLGESKKKTNMEENGRTEEGQTCSEDQTMSTGI